MTLAGWSFRKMPLRVPQEPIITEKKNGGVTTPAPLAVPDQQRHRQNESHHGRVERAWRRGGKYEPVQNEESCALLDALVDEGGAYYATAGALRGGRETFVTMHISQRDIPDPARDYD